MTTVPESRIARLAEVLLHAERGAPPGGGMPSRLRNRFRARSSAGRSSGTGTSARAGVAEQLAGIIESLDADDLAALVEALERRA